MLDTNDKRVELYICIDLYIIYICLSISLYTYISICLYNIYIYILFIIYYIYYIYKYLFICIHTYMYGIHVLFFIYIYIHIHIYKLTKRFNNPTLDDPREMQPWFTSMTVYTDIHNLSTIVGRGLRTPCFMNTSAYISYPAPFFLTLFHDFLSFALFSWLIL